MKTSATIRVIEIHCAACENTIRSALSKLPGIRSVTPDHQSNEVHVEYEGRKVDEHRIRQELADIGFDPVS